VINHSDVPNKKLYDLIKNGEIHFAGNKKLKIYGQLNCSSGMRMKPENRVFFETEGEAIQLNFRPCGHCMNKKYRQWKKN
jgi:methylphosphotriester-DNA--protein-cysteine methyltransferase